MAVDAPSPPGADTLAGLLSAGGAFLIWGLSPVYWKSLSAVPALEILMHRMVWSFLFLFPLVLAAGQWHDFLRTVSRPGTLGTLLATTGFVGCNWYLFIWAINSGHILQASLGYYINPLVNVLLGTVFLKERLRRLQAVAVAVAGVGVAYLGATYGEIPWVSLALAFSFGFYGLIRKAAPVGPLVGLAVETLLLSLPALCALLYLEHSGRAAFLHAGVSTSLLLAGSALVTGLPLLLFTRGTKRLRLTTVGFLQYIAPSCAFLLAVFVYREPLVRQQLVTFLLIWAALGLYTVDAIRDRRLRRRVHAS